VTDINTVLRYRFQPVQSSASESVIRKSATAASVLEWLANTAPAATTIRTTTHKQC
jgi:hypothetical protein